MPRQRRDDDFQFEGFSSPNTTPVPDLVFDRLLARLGEAELKALLYIIRRTFGFKRNSDPISFNQFIRGITTRDGRVLDEGCGVRDRTTLSNALKSLEKKGIVLSMKGEDERGENQTTIYALRFKKDDLASENEGGEEYPDGVVGNSYHRSRIYPPPVVGNSYPQETGIQQTEISLSNIRKGTSQNDFVDNSGKHVDNSVTQLIEPYHTGSVDGRDSALTTNPATSINETNNGSERDFETIQQWGMEALGDILKRRRGRPTREELEERDMIQAFIKDFARLFHDRVVLKSSVTRAYNIYKASGMHPSVFQDCMYQAKLITQDYQSRSRIKESPMAYYFRVLEDKSGVNERPYTPPAPH